MALTADRFEELDADPRPRRKPRDVHRPGDRHGHDSSGRHRSGQPARSAVRPQLVALGDPSLGKYADAPAGSKHVHDRGQLLPIGAPRVMRNWPMPSSTQASGRKCHNVDLARARTFLRCRAATPTTTGSQKLSWLPIRIVGRDVGTRSAPTTSSRPQRCTMGDTRVSTRR